MESVPPSCAVWSVSSVWVVEVSLSSVYRPQPQRPENSSNSTAKSAARRSFLLFFIYAASLQKIQQRRQHTAVMGAATAANRPQHRFPLRRQVTDHASGLTVHRKHVILAVPAGIQYPDRQQRVMHAGAFEVNVLAGRRDRGIRTAVSRGSLQRIRQRLPTALVRTAAALLDGNIELIRGNPGR